MTFGKHVTASPPYPCLSLTPVVSCQCCTLSQHSCENILIAQFQWLFIATKISICVNGLWWGAENEREQQCNKFGGFVPIFRTFHRINVQCAVTFWLLIFVLWGRIQMIYNNCMLLRRNKQNGPMTARGQWASLLIYFICYSKPDKIYDARLHMIWWYPTYLPLMSEL